MLLGKFDVLIGTKLLLETTAHDHTNDTDYLCQISNCNYSNLF